MYSQNELKQMGLEGAMPSHVAIIMDGNGRWAKSRGWPRIFGHRAGTERLKGIIRLSSDIGIKALSLYAFSTENWKRPEDEVSALFGLLEEYFLREIDELDANKVRITPLGDLSRFPKSVREAINKAMARTGENDGLKLNIGLNYGGHDELVRAFRLIARDIIEGKTLVNEIDEATIEERLDTAGLPPVDFLIRTGGEKRLSNFLLFQAAYAELLFLGDYWPDFTDKLYIEAIRDYQGRVRRYGGL